MMAVVFAVLAVALAGVVVWFVRDERRARDVRDQQQAKLVADLALTLTRAATEQAETASAAHVRAIDAVAKANGSQMEAMIRLATTGATAAQAVAIAEHGPDAIDIAQRTVNDDVKRRAMSELREGYKKLGMQVSDEDLAAEVDLILAGVPLERALGAHVAG